MVEKKNRNVNVCPQSVNAMQSRHNKISKIKYYLLLKFAKNELEKTVSKRFSKTYCHV